MYYKVTLAWGDHYIFSNGEEALIFAESAKRSGWDDHRVAITLMSEAEYEEFKQDNGGKDGE